MRTKIFIILFFDKVKFIWFFLFLVTLSGYLIMLQVDGLLLVESDTIEIPDIEIMGNQYSDSDGLGEFNKLAAQLDEMKNSNTQIYHIFTKNLYTFSSPFYEVSFQSYAVEKAFFKQFANRLEQGTIPKQGKQEVLLGYNAALYYQLEVGDLINEKMPFDIGTDKENYIVSGILGKEYGYFRNGFYLLKENYQVLNRMPKDNMIMIYTSNGKDYKEMTDVIYELKSKDNVLTYVDNYKAKASEKNKPLKDFALVIAECLLFLDLLYLFMSRGLEKKVGIIKALGIPDRKVLIISGTGFAVLIIFALIMIFGLSLTLLNIRSDLLFLLTLAIGIAAFLILFIQITLKYKRITPYVSIQKK